MFCGTLRNVSLFFLIHCFRWWRVWQYMYSRAPRLQYRHSNSSRPNTDCTYYRSKDMNSTVRHWHGNKCVQTIIKRAHLSRTDLLLGIQHVQNMQTQSYWNTHIHTSCAGASLPAKTSGSVKSCRSCWILNGEQSSGNSWSTSLFSS